MKRNNKRASIKQLTICSMLTALGVIFLEIGAIFDVLDISMAVVASLCVVIALIEYGKGAPWMVYFAISILSLILLPNKLPAVFFALFLGFYPILREKIEKRKKRFIRWLLKELIFNVCLAIMMLACALVDPTFYDFGIPISLAWILAFTVVICEILFILYDIALMRMITFYVIKLRHRFKFK